MISDLAFDLQDPCISPAPRIFMKLLLYLEYYACPVSYWHS